jgi:hypothetical protein
MKRNNILLKYDKKQSFTPGGKGSLFWLQKYVVLGYTKFYNFIFLLNRTKVI